MERILLRFFLALWFFLLLVPPLFCLDNWYETCEQIDTLKDRKEGTYKETELKRLIQNFLEKEQWTVKQLDYTPSSLVHSFSSGLYVKVPGAHTEANAFFIFPLDQLSNSSSTSNNAGLYVALQVLQAIKKRSIIPESNLYFVFLGGELTRNIPIGSLFLLQNSTLNFKNSFFYYFEISSLKNWSIHTRGQKAYYATPAQQLKDFLRALQHLPSLNYKVVDTFPIKNLFQEHDKEPFETYSMLSLPFMRISSPDLNLSLKELKEELAKHNWYELFTSIGKISLKDNASCTNQYYLYFHFFDSFCLIDSSYYLIFILLLANLITFTGFRQIRYVNERVKKTLQFSWYFIFLLFLFSLCLALTSHLFPLIKPFHWNEQEASFWLLYLKIAFASFLNFLFLYLAHPTLGNISKQNYLYMSLFFFLVVGVTITFYNILSSFFFFLNVILVFLGIVSSGLLRLILNFSTFFWLLYILNEGLDAHWLKYFLGSQANANLILSSYLFPYQLLILSYTTPTQRKHTRSLFSKMHTTLLGSFLFALIVIWSDNPSKEESLPTLAIQEEWDVATQTSQYFCKLQDKKETLIAPSLPIKLQQDWNIQENQQAPKPLEEFNLQAQINWQRTLLFKRQDYQLKIHFPFEVEKLELKLNNNASFIPPIVYRSNLPYEMTQKGDIIFRPGPNPPSTINLDFSLDCSDKLSLSLSFTSPVRIRKKSVVMNGNLYQLQWKQKVSQTIYSPFKENLEKVSEPSLSKDPILKRLESLPLPKQKLFP